MRLIAILWGTDMRLAHDGLLAEATGKNKALALLKPGECIAFVNEKRDRIKLLAGSNHGYPVLGYFRSKTGRIDVQAIQFIAQAFNGSRIDYNAALKKSLLKRLPIPQKSNEILSRRGAVSAVSTIH